MRRITIEFGRDEDDYSHINMIDEYGRETGTLCFGEMLEQVAVMVAAEVNTRGPVPYLMLTREQWAERERRTKEQRLARQKEAAA